MVDDISSDSCVMDGSDSVSGICDRHSRGTAVAGVEPGGVVGCGVGHTRDCYVAPPGVSAAAVGSGGRHFGVVAWVD